MTGYVHAMGPCFSCSRPFVFNPHKVPSLRVEGVREPICEVCMGRANAVREQMGLEPHPVAPDAYAPMPEGEL